MLAIGSAVGSGLFFGSGISIKLTGPSILLAYAIGGVIMYIVLRALGEMTVHEPNVGSFSHYAYKYAGAFAGFISGWNYWFLYIIVGMLELTACTMFFDYWYPSVAHWIVASIILSFFTLINLLKVKFFGEFEFWFASIKVATIIFMIIFGAYIVLFTKQPGSGIQNLWKYGGFFTCGIQGFLFSFVVVIFSFGGTELVSITAGETQNPQKAIPLAINGIIVRIIIFYLTTLMIVICLHPWNKISENISPFVDVFNKIGIPKVALLMNIVAITAALSSFNANIYATGRMLYNLGSQGNAPKICTKLNNNGVPYMATLISLAMIFLVIILNYIYSKHLFNILLAIATIAAILNWITILLTQLIFRKKVKISTIKYKMPLHPLGSIVAIIFFIIIIITMSYMDNMRLAVYIAPVWLFFLTSGYLIKRCLEK